MIMLLLLLMIVIMDYDLILEGVALKVTCVMKDIPEQNKDGQSDRQMTRSNHFNPCSSKLLVDLARPHTALYTSYAQVIPFVFGSSLPVINGKELAMLQRLKKLPAEAMATAKFQTPRSS